MQPPSQRAVQFFSLATWKQRVCRSLYLFFNCSHLLVVRVVHVYMAHTPLQVHITDCIGSCQNMRMHLQKAGALSCTVCPSK